MKRPASLLAAVLFWLIALAQLLRILLRVEVRAGDVNIPLWVSIVAFVAFGRFGNLALARAPRVAACPFCERRYPAIVLRSRKARAAPGVANLISRRGRSP